MSGLELPGLIIGLSGLIAVFEKSFEVWHAIQQARSFGDDVADWMCKLEMEFFRFQTWWTALERLSVASGARAARQPRRVLSLPISSCALQTAIQKQFGEQVTDAATSVLKLLEKARIILERNGMLAVKQQLNQSSPVPTTPDTLDLSSGTAQSKARLRTFRKELMRHTSCSIVYWNDALYSILPQALRDSVLQLGIAGYVFDDAQQGADVARLGGERDGLLRRSAKILAVRAQFDLEVRMQRFFAVDEIVRQVKKPLSSLHGLRLGEAAVAGGAHYSVLDYSSSADGEEDKGWRACRALVEWIPFPKGGDFKLQELAAVRMARLSYSLQQTRGLSSIHPLACVGFVEYADAASFGLVFELPAPVAKSTVEAVTLHQILSYKQARTGPGAKPSLAQTSSSLPYPLPSLEQRKQLAVTLVTNFYSFLLTRWHHERLSSLHVAFLVDKTARTSSPSSPQLTSAALDFTEPIIGGFAVSRPDSPTELSMSCQPSPLELLYLHPAIRTRLASRSASSDSTEPAARFQRIYDIYALGLLLAEVGFWKPVSRLAEGR
ncbi:unnamed protein product [Parascedosporium putredinis]|uniref:Prion-inhibition and propagation HeLo domain-containing protein n=1 Tax=Parascedosporium putredinis TaxID=1442378 RepID=A0A9P1GWL8_9PEZI|nr:unnamed protein product [Parascedosporium putredinis]CAI7989654.1 unnamed protein product [Parascedosporium putredinis]